MKKVLALLTATAFALSLAVMASAAQAAELSTYGRFFVSAGGFHKLSEGTDTFNGAQEYRQFFDITASENLKGTLAYDIKSTWGASGSAPAGADQTGQLELKRSNLKFNWPGSELHTVAGIQYVAVPSGAIGTNPVLAGDMAGAVMSSPITDAMSLTFGWSRPYNTADASASPGLDTFFASVPISQDGFSVSPYGIYSIVGDKVDTSGWSDPFHRGFNTLDGPPALADSANAYWVGSSFELSMLDPMLFSGSLIYGSLNTDQSANERAGYYADFSAKYQMGMMTPEFYGWYASGEDDKQSDGSETMPIIYNDGTTSKGPGIMVGDFTTFGVTTGGTCVLQMEPYGLWAAGMALNNIKMSERLTGNVMAAYYQGTNDKEVAGDLGNMGMELTEEDSAWEVAMSSKYMIYEGLSAVLEAAVGQADMDEDVWAAQGGDNYMDETAHRVVAGFAYNF